MIGWESVKKLFIVVVDASVYLWLQWRHIECVSLVGSDSAAVALLHYFGECTDKIKLMRENSLWYFVFVFEYIIIVIIVSLSLMSGDFYGCFIRFMNVSSCYPQLYLRILLFIRRKYMYLAKKMFKMICINIINLPENSEWE